jgi:sec-independent protein translocase protein TatA
MFGLGVPELIFILLLALLIFGPKKLPEIGRTLGKGMSEFRKASNELTRSLNAELALDEEPVPPQVRRATQAQTEPRSQQAPLIAAVPALPPLHEDEVIREEAMRETTEAKTVEPPVPAPIEPS